MKELFVPHKECIELKDLGFNEPCVARHIRKEFSMNVLGNWYKHNSNEVGTIFLSTPLYSQVFKWFRNNYNLDGWVVPYKNLDDDKSYSFIIDLLDYTEYCGEYGTYEIAELECLRKLIKIIKDNILVKNGETISLEAVKCDSNE